MTNGLNGRVRNIRTKTKVTDEGEILHLTTVNMEFSDLDRDTLEALAVAERALRLVTMELLPGPQTRG